jgi:hypothetical protein
LYVQRRANAMASVGPTPVKCHEPTAMAVACSDMTVGIPRRNYADLELFVHDARKPQDVGMPYEL